MLVVLCGGVCCFIWWGDLVLFVVFFFFFNDTATTEIYTLSLHDALPILCSPWRRPTSAVRPRPHAGTAAGPALRPSRYGRRTPWLRSWPRARPQPRRRRAGPAAADRPAARPTRRTSRGQRAGSWRPATRTYVRIRAPVATHVGRRHAGDRPRLTPTDDNWYRSDVWILGLATGNDRQVTPCSRSRSARRAARTSTRWPSACWPTPRWCAPRWETAAMCGWP